MNIQIVLIFTIARVQRKEEFIQQGTFIMSYSFLFFEDFFFMTYITHFQGQWTGWIWNSYHKLYSTSIW